MSGYMPPPSRHDWGTPQELFDWAQAKYGPFDVDAAASSENTKFEVYFDEETDALEVSWGSYGKTFWLNPPYGRHYPKFVKKAWDEVNEVGTEVEKVVILIAARTDTKVWQDIIAPNADRIVFLRGRVHFDGHGPAPFASAIVVFDKTDWGYVEHRQTIEFLDWKAEAQSMQEEE